MGAWDESETHVFDTCGNLISEGLATHYEWDHNNRLRVFRSQTTEAEPSVYALYLYDSAGQRVKKLVRKEGGTQFERTINVDGIFEHHRQVDGLDVVENNTLHVMDNQSRVALVRVGDAFERDAGPSIQYHLGDHLGTSVLLPSLSGAYRVEANNALGRRRNRQECKK